MSTFELVVEQVRSVSGADFAFVLTRRGRLVTREAPRDMPEVGRNAIVDAARLLQPGAVGEMTMPRQELVPYGGAAPIDVHFGVASEQAIVCVVMSSWVGKGSVPLALKDGVAKIEAVIAASGREPMRRRKTTPPPPSSRSTRPPPPSSRSSRPPPPPPPSSRSTRQSSAGKTTAGLVIAEGASTHAARSLERSPVIQSRSSRPPPRGRVGSLPEITLGTAELGRESLAAVERELATERRSRARASSAPSLTVGEGDLDRESLAAIDDEVRGKPRASAPLITFGEAELGRESLAAIDREVRGTARGSAPRISVGEADLGRESLAAIELEDAERPSGVRRTMRPPATSMPDSLRVELESVDEIDVRATPNPDVPRSTRPWAEAPEDTKRALDAERLGRQLAPPVLTLRLEDADTDVFEAARLDPRAKPYAPAAKRRK